MATDSLAELRRHFDGNECEKLDGFLAPYLARVARAAVVASAAARKVFAIPELLESIFLYLGVRDILRVQIVSRAFRDVVEQSTKIQRECGFLADYKTPLRLPLTSFEHNLYLGGSLCVSVEGLKEYQAAADECTLLVVAYTIMHARSPLSRMPQLGPKARSILVFHPPVKQMDIVAGCCGTQYNLGSGSFNPEPACTISLDRENGITFGDIIDAVPRVRAEHVLCPDAAEDDHDEQGFACVSVTFYARVKADLHHPVLAACRRREDEERTQQTWEARITSYAVAKRAARDRGFNIPTLAEHETLTQRRDAQ